MKLFAISRGDTMISVVIPCLEDEMLLHLTLASIACALSPVQGVEVLVVHGGHVRHSTSSEKLPVQEYHGPFKRQAEALNFGIMRAKGDIICTTKPGCIVASDWLIQIEHFLKHYPTVDGVGGPVFPSRDFGNKIQRLASQIFSEDSRFPRSIVFLGPNKLQPLFHATNNAFRRRVFESVEYDRSFSYDFDFDISWRLLRMGHRLAFNPKMCIDYIFPFTLRKILCRYYAWGKDYTLLMKRYYGGMNVVNLTLPFYNLVRFFVDPRHLVSSKKLLELVQLTSFNLGRMEGTHSRSCIYLSHLACP
jgi:hypothetical protein